MLTLDEILGQPYIGLDDDTNPTPTFEEEAATEKDIYHELGQYLKISPDAIPPIPLDRKSHIAFLDKMLLKPLPPAYVAFDATRPWVLYWCLHSLTLLGHPIAEYTKARAVTTLLGIQNHRVGGFGGSSGQIPHLMTTYAAINTLAIAGGPGPAPEAADLDLIRQGKATMTSLGKGGWDDIDRAKMYAFLMRLKQPDGSFTVHDGGEVDVRTSYCVWCIAILLGIATQELLRGTKGFLVSCQSYEGGLASTSYPTYSKQLVLNDTCGRPALGEAHGGYAFCATAAYLGLRLLDPRLYASAGEGNGRVKTIPLDDELDMRKRSGAGQKSLSLNLSTLTRWTLGLQCPFPSQGGGFKGRINKLVDGCYSWFSGAGMWGVLESLHETEALLSAKDSLQTASPRAFFPPGKNLWSRESLQLYILLVAQNPTGGLRDKPGKKSDAYHTCYNLAGLSASQHIVRPCETTRGMCYRSYRLQGQGDGDKGNSELRRRIFASTLGYNLCESREETIVGKKTNEVAPTHPVLNISFVNVQGMMMWAYSQR